MGIGAPSMDSAPWGNYYATRRMVEQQMRLP
jgi:hypothetical protein